MKNEVRPELSNTMAVYHALYARKFDYTAISRGLLRPFALCPWGFQGSIIQAMLFPNQNAPRKPPFPAYDFWL